MHDESVRRTERFEQFGHRRIVFGLDEHGFAVRRTHGHAYARRRNVQIRQFEHLARFDADLDLFARVAVLVERADLRNDVAENLRDERRFARRCVREAVGFRFFRCERVEPGAPRTAHGLIRRDAHRTQPRKLRDRRERDAQHDRRAIGNGEEIVFVEDRVCVHFGNNERHVDAHAIGGGIVDDDRTARECEFGERLARVVARCEEHGVEASVA